MVPILKSQRDAILRDAGLLDTTAQLLHNLYHWRDFAKAVEMAAAVRKRAQEIETEDEL